MRPVWGGGGVTSRASLEGRSCGKRQVSAVAADGSEALLISSSKQRDDFRDGIQDWSTGPRKMRDRESGTAHRALRLKTAYHDVHPLIR